MNNADHFRQKLLRLKNEITQRISSIDTDIKHEGMTADWTEQASERENDEVLESLGNASEQELLMVNAALQRIESGDYFCCSACGETIPEARLELLPFTKYCIHCAEKLED